MLMVTHFQIWGFWCSEISLENSHCSFSYANTENFETSKKKNTTRKTTIKSKKKKTRKMQQLPGRSPKILFKNLGQKSEKISQSSAPKVTLDFWDFSLARLFSAEASASWRRRQMARRDRSPRCGETKMENGRIFGEFSKNFRRIWKMTGYYIEMIKNMDFEFRV